MFVLYCPRCRGYTAADDDATKVACQWCHLWVKATDKHTLRGPEFLRQFVLSDLWSVADLMRAFGIGQTVIAATYFVFFLGCGGLIAHFTGQMNELMLIAIGVVLFVGGVFIIAGSIAIRRGRQRSIAVVGAIFALASPLLLGLPIGAWALWKLNRPEVRAAFAPSVGRPES